MVTGRLAPDSPVVSLVAQSARLAPDRVALVGLGTSYLYAELIERVESRADWLRAAGLEPGDRVGACARNHPELVVLFLACMTVGGVWVGLAPALAPDEKRARIEDAGVRFVLVDQELEDQLAGVSEPNGPASAAALRFDSQDFVATTQRVDDRVPIDAMAPAAIAYTSGSTGSPKGVVHCQAAIATAVEGLATLYPWGMRHGACLALTTLNMLMASALVSLVTAGTCAITDSRQPKELAEWIRSERVQTFPAVATLLYDLLNDPDVSPEDLASLERPALGGMAVDPALREGFRERFGHAMSVGYGLSEGPCTVARRLPEYDAPPESVGPSLPHVQITVRDGEGRALAPDESGEICVGPATSGPFADRYVPMLGYWKQDELSRRALRGGLLHTGDLGWLDAKGNLFVGGRMDQTIKRAGSNIPAGRVESVVARHPGVGECVAIGLPDLRVGERIVVAFEPVPGSEPNIRELEDLAASALAPFEQPDAFVAIESLPRTSSGKVARGEVRRLLEQTGAPVSAE